MDTFKIPDSIPQDLLFIQDIIGDTLQPLPYSKTGFRTSRNEENISSSGSESDVASEDEIEAVLMRAAEDEVPLSNTIPSLQDSGSDSSSDSDSDVEDATSEAASRAATSTFKTTATDDLDDDEDGGPPQSGPYIYTKNEVMDVAVHIPDVQQVGPEEVLEKVGEVMSIVDKIVIIKALPSEIAGRGLDKALDSDTLLVFDDRLVLGYIYETFGPTSQPLYQVRFNNSFPLDTDKVRVAREVFHVPQRSNFVFLREIRRLKGSDASNVHDEEPAEDELEFSDDDAETAHRGRMKRKRGASRASSQQPHSVTPRTYDHDLTGSIVFSGSAYDAYGPYDADYGAGPSRPPPMPYDDPYSDEYNGMSLQAAVIPVGKLTVETETTRTSFCQDGTATDRGRGRTRARDRAETWGRGKKKGQSRRTNSGSTWSHQPNRGNAGMDEPYSPYYPRPLASNTFASETAGERAFDTPYETQPAFAQNAQTGAWPGYMQSPSFGVAAQGYQQPMVQPHINPRFASAFGLNVYSQQLHPEYACQTQNCQSGDPACTDDWTLHMDHLPTSNQTSGTNDNAPRYP
ncbi:hypothetical protein AX17_000850 [Amanita inopinata Kibby_2008]|nr:hypothetical protein AX17_000850 [Amanita inopinata Kibby_2008]